MIYYTVGRDGIPVPEATQHRTWGDAKDEGLRLLADNGPYRAHTRLEILKVTTANHGYAEER